MDGKRPKNHDAYAAIDVVTDAGLEFGRAVLVAEAQIVASVLNLGAALVAPSAVHSQPETSKVAESDPEGVEEGFDNMPV